MGFCTKSQKIVAALLSLLLLGMVFFAFSPRTTFAAGVDTGEEFRGVWVATVYSLNYPSVRTTDPTVLKADALEILDNAAAMGFNAVILQVRPASDAFYQSELYPWSAYLTGAQGTAPTGGFDPLAFFVEEAHQRGLELHAWINPYRITGTDYADVPLAADSPALLYPELTVAHTDGRLYWNPGEPAARKLIADGVLEIVENYNVDGVQIDDYFYPGTEFADAAAYAKYGGGFADIGDWRRDNNDKLVEALYDAVHSADTAQRKLVFGVSPQGIWANKSANMFGSDTAGSQAYYAKFADARGWVKKGLVDYIAPQIYWNFGYEIADYKIVSNWWSGVVQGTDVDLYIGMAAYRACNTDSSSPWYGTSEIRKQVEWNRQKSAIGGYCMYSYAIFAAEPAMEQLMKELNGTEAGPAAPEMPEVPAPTELPVVTEPAELPELPAGPLFSDLPLTHWACENVSALVGLGAVSGYPDGTFKPENNITRAEFLKISMEAVGWGQGQAAGARSFAAQGQSTGLYWYSPYYAKAMADGILLPTEFTEEALGQPINRSEMALILMRIDGIYLKNKTIIQEGTAGAIADYQSIDAYYRNYVAAAYQKGLLTGYPDGSFRGEHPGTRAEAATMILRLLP